MNRNLPFDLKPGLLHDIEVPFVFGSEEDIAFRQGIFASTDAKIADLLEIQDRAAADGLAADESDLSHKLAMALLACGKDAEVILFSVRGIREERGMKLIGAVTRHLTDEEGKALLLLDYSFGKDSELLYLLPVCQIRHAPGTTDEHMAEASRARDESLKAHLATRVPHYTGPEHTVPWPVVFARTASIGLIYHGKTWLNSPFLWFSVTICLAFLTYRFRETTGQGWLFGYTVVAALVTGLHTLARLTLRSRRLSLAEETCPACGNRFGGKIAKAALDEYTRGSIEFIRNAGKGAFLSHPPVLNFDCPFCDSSLFFDYHGRFADGIPIRVHTVD